MTRYLSILALFCCVSLNAQPFSLNDKAFLSSTSELRKGLVGYWQLEEAAGTRYDRSPYGNHLTSNNSVGSAAGKVGNCGTFTAASSQSLSIADNASLSLGDSQFTFALWVFLSTTNTSQAIFSKRDTSPASGTWNVTWNATLNSFVWTVYGAGGASVGTVNAANFGAPSVGAWNFVVVTHDSVGNTITIAVNDGIANSASTSGPLVDDATLVRLGAQNATAVNFFDGRLDEVGVWNRLLNAAEIAQLYNAGPGTTWPRFGK